MSGLLDSCQEFYKTKDLYGILGLTKDASENEVKRAYRKLSLKVHPDRVEDDKKAEATQKFQTLAKLYVILSDKDMRAVYDETGEVDDENDIPRDRDWNDYWRLLFQKITVKDIEDFEKSYKGSEEELEDLKTAYVDYKGDMDAIMEGVMCASQEDESRFQKILKDLIKTKKLPAFDDFTKEKASKKRTRKQKAQKEEDEAEELKREMGIDGANSLQALIKKNQQSRGQQMDGFFSDLEAKYAQPKKTKSNGTTAKKGKGKGKK